MTWRFYNAKIRRPRFLPMPKGGGFRADFSVRIMQHTTGSFRGLGGLRIFTRCWLPDGNPRGVVIVVHGYGEHSGRYAHVACAMVERGYAVYALDHRGHGQSEGTRVQVERFDDYVTDLRTYFEEVRAAQPGLPIFVYGHSMGSLIGLLFALRYQDDLAGLIVTGAALKPIGVNGATKPLLRLASRAIPAVRLVPLAVAGISRDPAVVERYKSDPDVVLGLLRLRLVVELVEAGQQCIAGLPRLRVPILALHGGADPICDPQAAAIIRQRSGSPDTTVKVYPGLYHEVHNEPEQAQVIGDMLGWLDAHVGPL